MCTPPYCIATCCCSGLKLRVFTGKVCNIISAENMLSAMRPTKMLEHCAFIFETLISIDRNKMNANGKKSNCWCCYRFCRFMSALSFACVFFLSSLRATSLLLHLLAEWLYRWWRRWYVCLCLSIRLLPGCDGPDEKNADDKIRFICINKNQIRKRTAVLRRRRKHTKWLACVDV